MSHHNVHCPKGYGDVAFIVVGTAQTSASWCPVSATPNCVACDIIPKEKLGADGQVKKKES